MKILVVDDEQDIRKIACLSLQAIGKFETSSAGNGPDAIDIAQRESPDLVLMDMMMPGMDGLTVLEKMQALPQLAGIPVMFMTARVQREEVAHYLSRGAVGVIQKPFDPLTLPEEVRRILAASRG